MSTQVVLTLSDDLYARAKQWAALTRRDLPETLTDALEIVLTPLLEPPEGEPPVTSMSDAEVMALAQAQMAPQPGKRLDRLLAKQREDQLRKKSPSSWRSRRRIIGSGFVSQKRWLRLSDAAYGNRWPHNAWTSLRGSASARARRRREPLWLLSHAPGICSLDAGTRTHRPTSQRGVG